MWWVWGVGANIAIGLVEAMNRTSDDTYMVTLTRTAPLILLAQWGLFRAYNGAPTLMAAWCIFTLGNTIVRLTMTTWLVNEPLSWYTYAGVTLITGGALLINLGRIG